MSVYGKNGLGSFLKVFLEIVFVLIIAFMIVVPFKYLKIIFFYPNIICLQIIILEFIGLFNQLKKEEPFCKKTIIKMKGAGIASAFCSFFFLLQSIYEIVLAKELFSFFVLLFMVVLFAGVSIALYILEELFIKATNYKQEIDLTI